MQRKITVPQQNAVSQMHYAVTPYEVEFSVPNDEIYSLYFQKGLQILGSTQYPIQNHQKLNKIQIPIQKNIIHFRLFSDRNSEYQWSIYKRVDGMEQFLETKKINLKDILKKQPERKADIEKKSELQRKTEAKNKIQGRSNKPQLKRIQPKSQKKGDKSKMQVQTQKQKKPQTENMQEKSQQQRKIKQSRSQIKTDGRSDSKIDVKPQLRGSAYNQSMTFQTAHFTIKFYLFKAMSYQQLSKAIQQKIRGIQEERVPLSQLPSNKLQEKPLVSQIQAWKCQVVDENKEKQNIQLITSRQGGPYAKQKQEQIDSPVEDFQEQTQKEKTFTAINKYSENQITDNRQKQQNNQLSNNQQKAQNNQIKSSQQMAQSDQITNNQQRAVNNQGVTQQPSVQKHRQQVNAQAREHAQENANKNILQNADPSSDLPPSRPHEDQAQLTHQNRTGEARQQADEFADELKTNKQLSTIQQAKPEQQGMVLVSNKGINKRRIGIVLLVVMVVCFVLFFSLHGSTGNNRMPSAKKGKKKKVANRKKPSNN